MLLYQHEEDELKNQSPGVFKRRKTTKKESCTECHFLGEEEFAEKEDHKTVYSDKWTASISSKLLSY